MTADSNPSARLRLAFGALAAFLVAFCWSAAVATAAGQAPYAPGVVVVGFAGHTAAGIRNATLARAGMISAQPELSNVREVTLRRGVSVSEALARLRGRHDVLWAVPDYIAHAAGASALSAEQQFPFDPMSAVDDQLVGSPFDPNDPGSSGVAGGWQQLQWNFAGQWGVGAMQAWGNLIADGHAGGRGVTIAVLDTGVAYDNHGRYVRSPDFSASEFVAGYDFVSHSRFANDRNGHGTQVAGTIAEQTNNGVGVTGLAYGVRLMPVRVLNAAGSGSATTIAKGVYFAVNHHAQIINLSLEFDAGTITASDIPQLIRAIGYAHSKNVLVVAAAGNDSLGQLSYPAKAPYALAVGASTVDGCLASYSNYGGGIALVAPGGGGDATIPGDANCHPDVYAGASTDIYQETFADVNDPNPRVFGLPGGYFGTSMAAPHVSAAAALVIASGVLGAHPTVAAITARLEDTATPLGPDGHDDPEYFGAGLLNAAAATAPIGSTGITGTTGTTGASGATGPSGST
ncbi:MAG TPA: S8 family serine peptidase [Solirubrobacteraceae bacterium]|nr:S8 family serine peptidase [Solirubrobacteraceae bacterium]